MTVACLNDIQEMTRVKAAVRRGFVVWVLRQYRRLEFYLMKRIAVSVLALALSAAAGGAVSAQDSRYDSRYDNDRSAQRSDIAQVVRVEPRFDRRDGGYSGGYSGGYQRQECWNEQYNRYDSGYYRDENGRLYRGEYGGRDSNANGTLLGAIIGGALGNQVGKGDGRKAATIGGAVIGGAIGNNIDRNHDSGNYDQYRDSSGVVRRCRTVVSDDRYDDRRDRRIRGYNVTYRYAGHTYHAVTRNHPGRTMRVLVEVRPQDDGVAYRR